MRLARLITFGAFSMVAMMAAGCDSGGFASAPPVTTLDVHSATPSPARTEFTTATPPTLAPTQTSSEVVGWPLGRPLGSLVAVVRTDQGAELMAVDLSCMRSDPTLCKDKWVLLTHTPKSELPLGGQQDDLVDLSVSPDGQRVAFSYLSSSEPDNWDIYSLDVGECVRTQTGCEEDRFVRLTDDQGADQMPAWAPNGQVIAFSSNRNGPFGLFLMAETGEDERQWSDPSDDARYTSPSWSPDSEYLAFAGTVQARGAGPKLYVSELREWKPRRVTASPNEDPVGEYGPAWYKDEDAVLFETLTNGQYQLTKVQIESGALTHLLSYQVHPSGVSFDATGDIVFATGPGQYGGDSSSVWALDPARRRRAQVSHIGFVVAVAWSPYAAWP